MIPIDLVHFTQSQQKILRLLADGEFHTESDICSRCNLRYQGSSMKVMVHYLRKSLSKHSDQITIETRLQSYVPMYRLIRPVKIDDSLFALSPKIVRGN